ncbi:MAG: arginine--tRNA ligase [Patescibacteria group bacterium]|nr:arginine--tRNA ligase [Patescibacteria group bacterium]MDD5172863.1 arginine--tRNA ligase [Patescibacteria group bacterium]
MENIKKEIIDLFEKVLPKISNFEFKIEPPPKPDMGDLTLECFSLAKVLKKQPEKIAKNLSEKFGKKIPLPDFIDRIEAVGPYLNIFLEKRTWFKVVCQEILNRKDEFGSGRSFIKKNILIEYSSPNTNKPQHLGHLRNNFLSWTIANLFSFNGAKVTKVNLVNDRGIHICKSMLAYQKWGEGKTPESEKMKSDHFVGRYYVLFSEKEKKDPGLIQEAQNMLIQWEEGNSEVVALWQKINEWGIKGIKETYKKIGVDFDHWYFESDIYDSGKKIIMKALKKNLCYKREDGAIEIDLKNYNLDKKVLLRPNGTSVYITQDIGLAYLKHGQFSPHKSIYVVASEQDYYFKTLFKILEIFGFKWVKDCYHLSYGMVFLPYGKMKSREGEIVDADEIIAQMEQLAKREILSRNANLSPIEVSQRAEIIALGALKFFLLKFTPEQEIRFNPQASISFEGDSGPYLQYTYARIQSILEKAEQKEMTKIDYAVLGNQEEIEILKLLFIFPEIIKKSTDDYNPSHLAQYLLKLGQKFNEFYHQHQVLKVNKKLKNARLVLIQNVAEVIKKGLNLMGIEVLKKM